MTTTPSDNELAALGGSEGEGLNGQLNAIERRCQAAKVRCQRFQTGQASGLRVSIPNGTEEPRIYTIEGTDAAYFADVPIESLEFIGDYQAIGFYDTDAIEAEIKSTDPTDRSLRRMVYQRWVEKNNSKFDELAPAEDQEGELDVAYLGKRWRSRVTDGSIVIEISPRTSQFFVNGPRTSDTTIKILGTGSQSHDEALTTLESLGTAFLFDIDVRYGLSFELAKRPTAQTRIRR